MNTNVRPAIPNEIVTLIINQLDEQQANLCELAVVSKQFHAITHPLIWEILDFDSINATQFFACISSQRLGLQPIRQLHLRGMEWTDEQLVRFLPLPQLTYLSLTNTSITDTGFQHCHQLTTLHLASNSLTQLSFATIGQLQQLCDFSWHVGPDQSPEWLDLLSCPLTHLRILASSVNEKTMATLEQFDRLVSLTLTLAHPIDSYYLLACTWPLLTTLSLQPCHGLDDPTLIAFLDSHPHLQHLGLGLATSLTDAVWDAMHHLTRVYLTGNPNITSNGVRRFIHHTSLSKLALYYCPNVHLPELNKTTIDLDQKAIAILRRQ